MSMLFNMCMTMWKVTLALSFFIPVSVIAGEVDQHIYNFGRWMRIREKSLADCTVVSIGFVHPCLRWLCLELKLFCFSFSNELSLPTVQLTRGIYLPRMINKCFFILIKLNENDVREKRKLVDNISQKLPDQPKAILFLVENEGQLTELPALSSVSFGLISDNALIFYRCPYNEGFTAVTLLQLLQSQIFSACSLQGQTLHVAYNNFAPYFHVNDADPEQGHLEEIYLETFLKQHQISAHFTSANTTWGSLDPVTGSWDGVVGMVSSIQHNSGQYSHVDILNFPFVNHELKVFGRKI